MLILFMIICPGCLPSLRLESFSELILHLDSWVGTIKLVSGSDDLTRTEMSSAGGF